MRAEPVAWSEQKHRQLQAALVGSWAEDTWVFPQKKSYSTTSGTIQFTLISPWLKTEIKYALWRKFASGRWPLEWYSLHPCLHVRALIAWLNRVAPTARTLLEKSLEQWELSLRSFLIETGQYKKQSSSQITATQQLHRTEYEDAKICLFRQIYHLVSEGYDDRELHEKDQWDLRTLGVALNRSRRQYLLNFTPIPQPWLRHWAKKFMAYNLSVRSAGDCLAKLGAIRAFAHFLWTDHPTLQPSGIDRAIILAYIRALRERGISEVRRALLLVHLRTFLTTCAYHLALPGLTKEQLIFEEDVPKGRKGLPREIPEEVLDQLRQHLEELPTTILRMVVILLECGLRSGELCTLPLECLKRDDKQEWYLWLYQWKLKKEHTIPLVDQTVIGTIQAQQTEIKARFGSECLYLFPSSRTPQEPFSQHRFADLLNEWALKAEIRDRAGALYHFQAHQFRHTVAMRLLNQDVPLDTISRLLGHASLTMTERYAYKRAEKLREELQRLALTHKTVNFQGQVVRGDPVATALDAQLLRRDIRGQALPVGGCGRPLVKGPCDHENKCLTCVFWLTSTEDLPALKGFLARASRLRQRALAAGSQVVVANQDRILPLLQLRITSLEGTTRTEEALSVPEVLAQLKGELAEMEAGLEEAQEAQLVIAVKQFERRIVELKAQIAALESIP